MPRRHFCFKEQKYACMDRKYSAQTPFGCSGHNTFVLVFTMNSRRFRWIIALLTMALAGVIGLQYYWINWSIRLNEEQFNKTVFSALNSVSNKLQQNEVLSRAGRRASGGFSNGFSRRADSLGGAATFEDDVHMWEYMRVMQLLDPKPLAERIPLDWLGRALQEELQSRGISSPYQYGVYAKAKRSFIIVNNYYVVIDNSPHMTAGGATNLYNSPYRVALFQFDVESPGYLALYFPNRTRLVIGSVWQPLLLSVLFTGIILFSFWYTVKVVYEQKKLSEMKNDFINNMTHEFKTPIATISLAADSIGAPVILSDPEKIKRFLDIIRQENRRMNSQVERVLQMAQLDSRELELNISEVDLHAIILQAADNFSVQVERRSGHLHTVLEAEQSVIEADPTHLAGIVHNLLDNANKYSPGKPDITVRTRNVPLGIEFTVQDKGVGIGKEARKYIFDRFYRVHTGNLHDVKGFGLGLSYVKAIVTAHKGLIDVKSELGRGSAFVITLPLRQ
jgi:two-component system phosphate regulon sensor histidine kinase PhoR